MNQCYRFSSQLQVAAARSCSDVTFSLVDTGSKSVFANPRASAMAVAGRREHAVIDWLQYFTKRGKAERTIARKSYSDVK